MAAHIVAAASGGPRADDTKSSSERKSIENGIWLCHTCSRLIDADPDRFTIGLMEKWKESAERRAAADLDQSGCVVDGSDTDALRMYRRFIDRPALQDGLPRCGNFADFVAALTEIIELLNTGAIGGRQLAKSRHDLSETRVQVGGVYRAVRDLRARYVELRQSGVIDEAQCMCGLWSGEELEDLEQRRLLVTASLNKVLRARGMEPIRVS